METEKRLFVGGLFSNVKEADLREKFSRYGTIQHVEIRKKKEIDGKTDKTFAYINIHTTEGKMKTCIGVFNNTSWKGSKMTIQCAKEDFMKRLKEERRNGFCAPNINKEGNVSFRNPLEDIESVREFHMKGAVPGTPVTESKEWVVGKYGRVLPVVNLRGKDKRKITKIDPSKYCHYLKKVDGDAPEAVTGRDLTWEIRTNETDLVKRQKGEFPIWQPPKKKQRSIEDNYLHKKFEDSSLKKNKDKSDDDEDMEIIASGTITLPGNRNYHSGPSDSESDYESMKSSLSGRKKMLIQSTNDLARKKNHQQRNEVQPNPTSTNVKYKRNDSKDQNENVHIPPSLSLQGGNTKKMEIHNLSLNTIDMDSEGDKSLSDRESVSSVDTDEIIVKSRKLQKSNAGRVVLTAASLHMNEFYSGSIDINVYNDSDDGDDEDDFEDDSNIDFLDYDEDLDALAKKIEMEHKHKFSSKGDQNSLPNVHTATKSRTVSGINIAEKKVKDDQHVHQTDIMSSRKVVMFSNIGSDDSLRKQNTASEDYKSDSDASSVDTDEIILRSQTTQKTNKEMLHHDESLSEFYGAVSDLMDENENSSEDESSGSESNLPDNESDLRTLAYKIETEYKQNLKRVPGYDYNQENLDNRINQTEHKRGIKNVEKSMSPAGNNEIKYGDRGVCDDEYDDDVDDDVDDEEEEEVKKAYVQADVEKKQHSQMTKDETLHGGVKKFRGTKHLFCTGHETAADKIYSPEADKTSQITCTASSSSSEHTKKSIISTKPPKELCKSDQEKGSENEFFSAKFDERLKQESNEKRLASLRQRQKEVKIQQEKIKTALANVDNSITQNKKIVFDSESEDEEDSGKREIHQSNISFNEDSKKTTETAKKPALFSESSESDSEDKDSDQERFRIRPEYEGTSGKKLMYLQSKVGKDERFKLDKRFLDSEDEEETDEQKVLPEVPEEGEKLKSLQILQEVVGRPLNIMSKNPAKKKIFRDMSMLRYDPSRDDHLQFEIKPLKTEITTPEQPEKKKEKKKRKDKASKVESADEAEPLPEVSRDRYFEVSATFTDIFGKKTDEKQQTETGFSFMSMF